jgi:hypothetical protein
MPPPRPDPQARGDRGRLALLVSGVALLVVAVSLPAPAIRWLRVSFHVVDVPMGWIELLSVHVNLIHVLLFAWIAALASGWRGLRRSRLVGGLLALALASEALQLAIPGRDPLWRDVGWDLVGAALGLAFAAARRSRIGTHPGADAGAANLRDWLAACLRSGPQAPWPEASVAVAAAHAQGVVALMANALASTPAAPGSLRAAFALAARGAGAQALLHTLEARRIASRLRDAGLDALFLKGAALSAWLYPPPLVRESADIDVLLPTRADADRLLAQLAAAGYTVPFPVVPGDLASFEWMALAPGHAGGTAVDIHWRLCNSVLFGDALPWAQLRAQAQPLPSLGAGALGLSPVHAFVHACMHRAIKLQFGEGDQLRLLYDVRLLASVLDAAGWERVVAIARELGLAGACVDALAVAAIVGAQAPEATLHALREAARGERLDVRRLRDWAYAQWASLRALPTWRLRIRWLRQRLFPDRAFLRSMYGDDANLVAARLAAGWRRLRERS